MKTSATTSASKKPTKVEAMVWNGGRLFWGLFLVVVGGLFLVNNFGYVAVRFDNLWRLWPLAIILAGLTTISIKNWLWKTVVILFILLSMAAIVWVGLGGVEPNDRVSTESVSSPDISNQIKRADISIKAGASRLVVDSRESDKILDSKLTSNRTKLDQTAITNGDFASIALAVLPTDSWWRGSGQNNLDAWVTRKIPIDLVVDAGASDIQLNLEAVILNKLNISAGASSLVMRLGDRASQTNATIDAGASRVIIRVPRTSGVEIKLDSGLVGASLDEFNEIDKTTYRTDNYSTSEKKISIQAKVGLASLRVERY